MSDSAKTPAEELHDAGFGPIQQKLAGEWAAARGPEHDQAVHGRNVGAAPPVPIVREGPYQLRADNGGTPPSQSVEPKK